MIPIAISQDSLSYHLVGSFDLVPGFLFADTRRDGLWRLLAIHTSPPFSDPHRINREGFA